MPFHSDLPALYLPDGLLEGAAVTLAADEAQHLRALRLRTGDRVLLLDGRGHRAVAAIEQLDRRATVVRIGPPTFDGAEAGPYIALSFGLLADKSRIEWCVEKGVELGVGRFLPLETERAEGHLHRARLERVAIAALKQSQRAWLPTIDDPVDIEGLAALRGDVERFYICHESAPLDDALAARIAADAPRRVLVAIGPEGGFGEREVERLAAAGGEVVSLGDARLRAETAALTAVALVRMIGALARRPPENDHGLRINPTTARE